MNITVDEMIELNNITQSAIEKAYNKGVENEKSRELPNNLFNALLDYGKKTKTLIDYHKSSSDLDGCYWIQLKPTRDGSEGVKCVEISFEENLTEIHHIGISKI